MIQVNTKPPLDPAVLSGYGQHEDINYPLAPAAQSDTILRGHLSFSLAPIFDWMT
jgi:hypothetical protein